MDNKENGEKLVVQSPAFNIEKLKVGEPVAVSGYWSGRYGVKNCIIIAASPIELRVSYYVEGDDFDSVVISIADAVADKYKIKVLK